MTEQAPNRYLDFSIDANFQDVKKQSSRKLQVIFCSDCRNKRLQ